MLNSFPLPRKARGLLKFRFIRKILHVIFSDDSLPEKWVFVTGCYNSGTTLLARILEADPRVNTLPGEGVRYTLELNRPEDIGWTRMWSKCVDYVQMPSEQQPDKANLIRRDWSLFYTRGGTINLEKSIVTVPRMLWLDANFKNAYFVGIVRSPFAVSKGIQQKAKPVNPVGSSDLKEYTMEMAADQWAVANETLAKNASKIANTTLITYEGLIDDPIDTIHAIYRSIGETPPPLKYERGILTISKSEIKINAGENKKRLDTLPNDEKAVICNAIKMRPVQSMLADHGIENYIGANEAYHDAIAVPKDSL